MLRTHYFFSPIHKPNQAPSSAPSHQAQLSFQGNLPTDTLTLNRAEVKKPTIKPQFAGRADNRTLWITLDLFCQDRDKELNNKALAPSIREVWPEENNQKTPQAYVEAWKEAKALAIDSRTRLHLQGLILSSLVQLALEDPEQGMPALEKLKTDIPAWLEQKQSQAPKMTGNRYELESMAISEKSTAYLKAALLGAQPSDLPAVPESDPLNPLVENLQITQLWQSRKVPEAKALVKQTQKQVDEYFTHQLTHLLTAPPQDQPSYFHYDDFAKAFLETVVRYGGPRVLPILKRLRNENWSADLRLTGPPTTTFLTDGSVLRTTTRDVPRAQMFYRPIVGRAIRTIRNKFDLSEA